MIYVKHSVGKSGTPIKIYKIKTMVDGEYDINHSICVCNKMVHNEHRITKIGKLLRRYWIDEIPQIINLLHGDIKLVGIRPMTKESLDIFPNDIQQKIIQQKPGLVGINYCFRNVNELNDIIINFRRYIIDYTKSPIITDLKYFIYVVYNILFMGVRSK